MRKMILYIATSLDGFIATQDGKTDWLHSLEDIGTDYGYQDFYNSIDTGLMGYKTYQEILNFDIPFPYPDKTNYVFSRQRRESDGNPVTFINSDPRAFAQALKEKDGSNIWLLGGSEINTIMLNAGLIDEVIIAKAPVFLGSGIPLFASGTRMKGLLLISSETFRNGMLQMKYRVEKD